MNLYKNKSILITGGTGSFGKSFVSYLLKKKYPFSRIIIFSRDEFKQAEMAKQFVEKNNSNLRFFLGDVRDKERLLFAFRDIDYVIHAAALKQVPAAEYNPIEFIKTNVLGSQNIIEASLINKVTKVLALSTDKAVAPINLYGATKLCAEKLFVAANNIVGKNKTSFSIIRYGNVMGSRGSVLPEFLKHNTKNIFNITDLRMTRFNILMQEAINLVTWSLENSLGGEIFIPKLKSFKITDLAKSVNEKYKFNVTGIRPGEKLHEELITFLESSFTFDLGNLYSILPRNLQHKYNKKLLQKKIKKPFSYNSEENNFLSIKEIKKILKENF